MNWVDLLIVAILILFAIKGFGRSLLFEIFDLFSFLLAFFLSLNYYNLASLQIEKIFSLPHSLSNVLGFILVWYISEMILFIAARRIFSGVGKQAQTRVEKFLSAVPALSRGVVFVALALVLTSAFPLQPQIKKSVQESRVGSVILAKTYQLETPFKNIFGGITQDTLSFLTINPKSEETLGLGFKTDKFIYEEKLEEEMIALVNEERKKAGVPPLAYDLRLRLAARTHSADMFIKGYFSHYTPAGESVADRAQEVGVSFAVVGENLAFAPSLEMAHQGLMNSPGHKANILSQDYRKIGIGAAVSSEYGIMFTQVFTN